MSCALFASWSIVKPTWNNTSQYSSNSLKPFPQGEDSRIQRQVKEGTQKLPSNEVRRIELVAMLGHKMQL